MKQNSYANGDTATLGDFLDAQTKAELGIIAHDSQFNLPQAEQRRLAAKRTGKHYRMNLDTGKLEEVADKAGA